MCFIISLTFIAYLRLNGVKAREHPVFKELTRVKQYFEKVKLAENPIAVEKRQNLSLDKEAAARIIKAGLVRSIFQKLDFTSLTSCRPVMINGTWKN